MKGRSENTATIKKWHFISLWSVTDFYFGAFPDQGREQWDDEVCQSTCRHLCSSVCTTVSSSNFTPNFQDAKEKLALHPTSSERAIRFPGWIFWLDASLSQSVFLYLEVTFSPDLLYFHISSKAMCLYFSKEEQLIRTARVMEKHILPAVTEQRGWAQSTNSSPLLWPSSTAKCQSFAQPTNFVSLLPTYACSTTPTHRRAKMSTFTLSYCSW